MGRNIQTLPSRLATGLKESLGSLQAGYAQLSDRPASEEGGSLPAANRRRNMVIFGLATLVVIVSFYIEVAVADLNGYLCFFSLVAMVLILSRAR